MGSPHDYARLRLAARVLRTLALDLRVACAALLAAQLIAVRARAEALPAVEAPGFRPRVDADHLWVLELRLGGRVLNIGVLAIERDGEILLPLDELASAFDLAIEVDAGMARAEGWLIHPERGSTSQGFTSLRMPRVLAGLFA